MGYDIGNTPGYAGKTLYERDARGGTRKHPRLRGEDWGFTVLSNRTWKHPRLRGEDHGKARRRADRRETPPLTRGRPDPDTVTSEDIRNTPAYAGKTRRTGCG